MPVSVKIEFSASELDYIVDAMKFYFDSCGGTLDQLEFIGIMSSISEQFNNSKEV